MAVFLGGWAGTDWSGDYAKSAVAGAWSEFVGGLSLDASPEHFGSSFGSALVAVGSTGAGFAEGGMFGKMAYVTRWDTPAGMASIEESGMFKAGSFVQRGRGNLLDYGLSGAAERYPLGTRMTKLVPKSVLRAPKGFEGFKCFMRQRTLVRDYRF